MVTDYSSFCNYTLAQHLGIYNYLSYLFRDYVILFWFAKGHVHETKLKAQCKSILQAHVISNYPLATTQVPVSGHNPQLGQLRLWREAMYFSVKQV